MASMLPLRRACSGGVLSVPPGTGADLLAAANAAAGEDRSAWSAQAKAAVERDPACPICFASPMEDTMITRCGHPFCRDCIDGFLSQPMENKCPSCRQPIESKEIVSASVYGTGITGRSTPQFGGGASAAPLETSAAKRQKSAANPHECVARPRYRFICCNKRTVPLFANSQFATFVCPPRTPFADLPIPSTNKKQTHRYVFEAKLRILLQELRKIRSKDATAKVLVFTQFKSTLAWLSEQLPKNGLGFRTISGSDSLKARGDALRAFRNDPPTTIFLLSVRTGAVGINLTSASHIFILEPW